MILNYKNMIDDSSNCRVRGKNVTENKTPYKKWINFRPLGQQRSVVTRHSKSKDMNNTWTQ